MIFAEFRSSPVPLVILSLISVRGKGEIAGLGSLAFSAHVLVDLNQKELPASLEGSR